MLTVKVEGLTKRACANRPAETARAYTRAVKFGIMPGHITSRWHRSRPHLTIERLSSFDNVPVSNERPVPGLLIWRLEDVEDPRPKRCFVGKRSAADGRRSGFILKIMSSAGRFAGRYRARRRQAYGPRGRHLSPNVWYKADGESAGALEAGVN